MLQSTAEALLTQFLSSYTETEDTRVQGKDEKENTGKLLLLLKCFVVGRNLSNTDISYFDIIGVIMAVATKGFVTSLLLSYLHIYQGEINVYQIE